MTLHTQATSAAPASPLSSNPFDLSVHPVRTDLQLPSQPRQRVFVELIQKLGLERLVLEMDSASPEGTRPRTCGFILNRVPSAQPRLTSEDALLCAKKYGFNLTLTEFVDLCVRYLRLDAGVAMTLVDYSSSRFALAEFVRLVGSYELMPLELLSTLPGEAIQVLAPCFLQLGVREADLLAAGALATHGD